MTSPLLPGRVTAAQLNERFPYIVLKPSDEPVTSNTTPQSDDHLSVPLDASTTYQVEVWLQFFSIAAADLKLQWSTPAGVAGWWTVSAQNLAGGTDTIYQGILTWAGQAQIEGNASDRITVLRGVITTGVSSGTLTLQWAQNTSNGTATVVRARSTISRQKVA